MPPAAPSPALLTGPPAAWLTLATAGLLAITVLITTSLHTAARLLAGATTIGLGVAFVVLGLAALRGGAELAGAAIGVGVAVMVFGLALLRGGPAIGGAAAIGGGAAVVVLGLTLLRGGDRLGGAVVIGGGAAVAVLGLGGAPDKWGWRPVACVVDPGSPLTRAAPATERTKARRDERGSPAGRVPPPRWDRPARPHVVKGGSRPRGIGRLPEVQCTRTAAVLMISATVLAVSMISMMRSSICSLPS
ncbi:hypothetical protein [Actinoplanes subglobosus]|uniref:Uncharacterized protein n=1 Tax=Actinoplanes subglobosus TaxID=1547892 RepID=A0ABV8IT24_9ACTN